jgi:hypothetical protein
MSLDLTCLRRKFPERLPVLRQPCRISSNSFIYNEGKKINRRKRRIRVLQFPEIFISGIRKIWS